MGNARILFNPYALIAVAMQPVPQASVSPSTPRSKCADAYVFAFVIVHYLREVGIDAQRLEIFMMADERTEFINIEIFDNTEY